MAVNKITPKQAFDWLKSGEAVLIDVREPEEFKEEHIAYASSLPLNRVKELLKQHQIPTDRKIIFHCLKGTRGEVACVAASDDNIFSEYEIYNIAGGITAWKEDGLPVILDSVSSDKPAIAHKNSGDGKQETIDIPKQVQVVAGFIVALLGILGLISGAKILFLLIAIFGAVFAFAGATGKCMIAGMLANMPWNK